MQGTPFWLKVIDCKPEFASLINTNVNLDFESADGLDEYESKKRAQT